MYDGFRPFTLTHGFALASIAALIVIFVLYALRCDLEKRRRSERTVAWVNALSWLSAHVWWMSPARFDVASSLPLHMCHIVSLLASITLLIPKRWLRTLLYFWGIGLCSQALLTPSLREAPDSVWFWAFWFEHGLLQAIAIYDVAVRGYRPTWRDYGVACAAALAYLAVVLPVDIALQTDYGFVGEPKPQNPSLLDWLGPWPQRIVFIVLASGAAMAALMLPWKMVNAFSQR
ncbi:MAG: TMEM164-related integral membrane acyltransferase [Burkholderiales bacterium]